MAANLITLLRILLAAAVILMFQGGFGLCVAAVLTTALVIYLDSLDGIIARKLGIESDFGALFDISGDRIVEHVYWIFFAVMGLVSIWVPVIFLSRSFLVDAIRSVAYAREGKTPFGRKTMMRGRLTHFLAASRFSRGVYGAGKVTAFLLLGGCLTLSRAPADLLHELPVHLPALLESLTTGVVWTVVVMNLIRGIPVLLEGRRYFSD